MNKLIKNVDLEILIEISWHFNLKTNLKSLLQSLMNHVSLEVSTKFPKDEIMKVVYKTTQNLQLLGIAKDKLKTHKKSEIYEISSKNCDLKYVGQTGRTVLTRFKEHKIIIKYCLKLKKKCYT